MSNVYPSSFHTRARPPAWSLRSTTVTRNPSFANRAAAAIPPMPAPTTTTRFPSGLLMIP